MSSLLLLCSPATTFAADDWHYVMTSRNFDKWGISEGVGELKIKGGQFNAKLFNDDPKDAIQPVRVLLSGNLKAGRLAVTATFPNSDVGTSAYTGKLTVRECYGGVGQMEVITLSNEYSMIGIAKTTIYNDYSRCR